MVLEGDLLRTKVLLHGDREVGPSLHRRVVRHDHDVAPGDPADPRDEPRSRRLPLEHPVAGERRELEDRGVGVEEPLDPAANGELPELGLAGGPLGTPAFARRRHPFAQLPRERLVVRPVLSVLL